MSILNNAGKPNTKFEIEGVEYITLNEEQENKLDESYEDIIDFMRSNDGNGKVEEVKNNIYSQAQELWTIFKKNLDSTKYNFNLNKDQWNFLSNLITEELSYDANTIFVAVELDTLMKKMSKDKFKVAENKAFEVTATEITYIYHLISTHKVSGLNKNTFIFADILRKIADISKLVNFYDTQSKNIAADVQDWVATFEPNVNMENNKSYLQSL